MVYLQVDYLKGYVSDRSLSGGLAAWLELFLSLHVDLLVFSPLPACWVVSCANSPHVIYVRNSRGMFNPFPVFFFVVPGNLTGCAVFMYSVMDHILTLMGISVLTMIFLEHSADKFWKWMLKLQKEKPAYWKPDKSRTTSGFFENIFGKCTGYFLFHSD